MDTWHSDEFGQVEQCCPPERQLQEVTMGYASATAYSETSATAEEFAKIITRPNTPDELAECSMESREANKK
jgi:hypothetical protein